YEYVEFYGFCNDIPSVMHDIDCLVLPSIIPETFGLVLGEAMLEGKPVITTGTGAQGEIVEDGISGFTVPPFTPPAIADKLTILAKSKELRDSCGICGRQRIIESFTHEKMIKNIEDFFGGIL
ncbi:MAG: glycosyltransferase family 4 protein, partial [Bacteroidales bacterium]|nr:glycosyltransferase family 4 protein [Bacteroidales bacterium]